MNGYMLTDQGETMNRDHMHKVDDPQPIKVERVPDRSDAELSDSEAPQQYRLEQARILMRSVGMVEDEQGHWHFPK